LAAPSWGRLDSDDHGIALEVHKNAASEMGTRDRVFAASLQAESALARKLTRFQRRRRIVIDPAATR
jgi:hypothetical protein